MSRVRGQRKQRPWLVGEKKGIVGLQNFEVNE